MYCLCTIWSMKKNSPYGVVGVHYSEVSNVMQSNGEMVKTFRIVHCIMGVRR